MKKGIAALLTTAAIVMTTACGGSSGAASGSGAAQTQAPAKAETTAAETAAEDAEGWLPTEDIEVIVGNSAGGGADLFTRKVVQIIDDNGWCPTNMTVVNKPGSSHVVGYQYLMEHGDDYHLDITSASFFTQPISGNSPFTFDDFAYVAMLCKDPNMLFAATNAPFTDFEGMKAYCEEHPGEVMVAGASAYSDDAILVYMLKELCGLDIQYVTYESGADVLVAVMGGHVQLGILNPSEVGDNIDAGKVNGIAVSAEERVNLPGMEEIPTFKELGVDIAHEQPRGFVMSPKASPEAIAYYAGLLEKVVATDEWAAFLEEQCMEDAFYGPEEWGGAVRDEYIEIYDKFVNIILRDNQ